MYYQNHVEVVQYLVDLVETLLWSLNDMKQFNSVKNSKLE